MSNTTVKIIENEFQKLLYKCFSTHLSPNPKDLQLTSMENKSCENYNPDKNTYVSQEAYVTVTWRQSAVQLPMMLV